MKCTSAVVLAGVLAVVLGASVKTEGGSAGVSPHVIGGDNVKHLDRPYTVRLRLTINGNLVRFCGAARLDRHWFITAAECLDQTKYSKIQLTYPDGGEFNNFESKHHSLTSLRYTHHPEYDASSKANNIALFTCPDSSPVTDFHALPQLPRRSEKNEVFSSSKVTVSGWTITNPTENFQPDGNITSYDTTMVTPSVCKFAYFFKSVSNAHICASSWGGKRLTEAHVGVPLVAKSSDPNSRDTLIGIAASVRPWATWLPVPTVFTNIAPVVEWIHEVTGIKLRD